VGLHLAGPSLRNSPFHPTSSGLNPVNDGMKSSEVKMIDEIIAEIEALPDAKAATEFSEKFVSSQPDIIGFILAVLEETSSEAQETGYFIALVVWRYFSRGKVLKTVSEKAIKQRFASINGQMEAFEEGDNDALDRILSDQDVRDSGVIRFVAEEVQAAREEDAISEDDAGTLFVVLKVVVECLQSAALD
jgi:hypothetical protein